MRRLIAAAATCAVLGCTAGAPPDPDDGGPDVPDPPSQADGASWPVGTFTGDQPLSASVQLDMLVLELDGTCHLVAESLGSGDATRSEACTYWFTRRGYTRFIHVATADDLLGGIDKLAYSVDGDTLSLRPVDTAITVRLHRVDDPWCQAASDCALQSYRCGPLQAACGDSGSCTCTAAKSNVLPVSLGGAHGVIDTPMVSVTICVPGTTSCTTVPNIHLDTGSTGLRVFKSALGQLPLPPETRPDGSVVGECLNWDPSDWGPVVHADLQLAGLTAAGVPMQVVDPAFAAVPSTCNATVDTASDGFNGIWGIGAPSNDCNSGLCTWPDWTQYSACTGTTCTQIDLPIDQQVQHVIPFLESDNNGFVLELPAVPPSGAPSAQGQLVFGIGTRANNTPPVGTKVIQTDPSGGFTAQAQGQSFPSGLDTGTAWWNIPLAGIPVCADAAPMLCPPAPLAIPVTIVDASNTAIGDVTVNVVSFDSLDHSYLVFDDIAASWPGSNMLMLGAPFFLGRDVYVGIAGQSSSLGTGPLFAY